MKPWECCEGDGNPWRAEPVCVHCNDARIVSKTKTFRPKELTPCPYCGDPQAREKLERERLKIIKPLPMITENDLTTDEMDMFKEWRKRGEHAMDCLRWIEGRRYDPAKDGAFLAEARPALKEWRTLLDHHRQTRTEGEST